MLSITDKYRLDKEIADYHKDPLFGLPFFIDSVKFTSAYISELANKLKG